MILMYLVYGSTEYNKEIHVVIGTNVQCMGLQNTTSINAVAGDACCNWY